MITGEVSEGDRFKVVNSFEALIILSWKAPFTDGFSVKLEPGQVLISIHDIRPNATGFYCTPETKKSFEERYIPEEIRLSESYGGFGVLIMNSDIGVNVEPVIK